MENASKALIIAGAILLALLLIGLGLAIFNMFDTDAPSAAIDQQAVSMFNSRWDNYGVRNQTAAQIRGLINTVNSHNASADGVYIHLGGAGVANATTVPASGANFNDRPGGSTTFRYTPYVSGAHRYDVDFRHDSNGRIRGMIIEPI